MKKEKLDTQEEDDYNRECEETIEEIKKSNPFKK